MTESWERAAVAYERDKAMERVRAALNALIESARGFTVATQRCSDAFVVFTSAASALPLMDEDA